MKSVVIFLVLLFCVSVAEVRAQLGKPYNAAIGLRMGASQGISGKYMFRPKSGFESIILKREKDMHLVLLYEEHFYPFTNQDLFFFIGGGGHVGIGGLQQFADNGVELGISGIIALEFKIPKVPLSISGDFRPLFSIVQRDTFEKRFRYDDGAVTIRYLIGARYKK